MADNGWVDSLSEEWISQPRSSPQQLALPSPENRGTINTLLSHCGTVLRERSFSSVNSTSTTNHHDASSERRRVPEWKQKVLSDFGGKDMFSPIQLESLFRPPTMGRSASVVLLPPPLPPSSETRSETKSKSRRSFLPIPSSSPQAHRLTPLPEEMHIRSEPLTRRDSAPAASSGRPALRVLNRQGLSRRRTSSSTSSTTDSETSKNGKRKAEHYADLEHDKRSNIILPDTSRQTSAPTEGILALPGVRRAKGHSRCSSSNTKRDEVISPVMMGRLSALSGDRRSQGPKSSASFSDEGKHGHEETDEEEEDEEEEAHDVVGSLNSDLRCSGYKRSERSVLTDGESSVWPSSPPVVRSQGGDDSIIDGSNFGLEREIDGYGDQTDLQNDSKATLDSPFTSPAKPPPSPPCLRSPSKSQALVPTALSNKPVEPFHPGSGGTTILKNIRNHKDAPKSPLKLAYRPRTSSQSSEEADDPFFTPHPFRYAEMPQTPPLEGPVKEQRSKSGSPLKLFHSYYDTYTNERLRQRLGELESSVAAEQKQLALPELEAADEGIHESESDPSFSGGSVVVNRLEALARKQEKAVARRSTSAEASFSRRSTSMELYTTAAGTTPGSPKRERSESTINSIWSNSSTRKHRRWGSGGTAAETESPANKGRTPKRIRRSHSGGYSRAPASRSRHSNSTTPHRSTPSQRSGGESIEDRRRIKMAPEPGSISVTSSRQRSRAYSVQSNDSVRSNILGREGSPTPEPKRRTKKVPILKDEDDGAGAIVPIKKGGERGANANIVFSGSKGDGMQGLGFFGIATEAEAEAEAESPSLRKGSVTTQDFLRQAEEVMANIRGKPLRSSFIIDPDDLPRDDDDDDDTNYTDNQPLDDISNSSHQNSNYNGNSVSSKHSINSRGSHSSMMTISKSPDILQHPHATKNNSKMLFDSNAMKWIKAKASALNTSKSTEADVFHDVSDLSVNSTEEARQLEIARQHWQQMSVSPVDRSGMWRSSRMVLEDEDGESIMEEQVEEVYNDRYKSGLSSSTGSRSSRISTESGFSAAMLRTETRTTSYATDGKSSDTEKHEHVEGTGDQRGDVHKGVKVIVENEDDRQDYEDNTCNNSVNERFSEYDGDYNLLASAVNGLLVTGPQGRSSSAGSTLVNGNAEPSSANQPNTGTNRFSSYNSRPRRRNASKTFYGRSISRITEEDEEVVSNNHNLHPDIVAGLRHVSLDTTSVVFNRELTPLPSPVRTGVDLEVPPPSSAQRRPEASFHLTPKTDVSFAYETTEQLIHLELSFFATRRGPNPTKKAVDASFSIAQENLVKHLTDIEPFHPYWDYLKTLQLTGRKLETLYKLNEWCPRLTELDVSDNQLGQLSGVPDSVLGLKVVGNCLSDDTFFAHLQNLQFLDLSGNPDLENLDALKGLRHLRELTADDCGIVSIDGLFGIEGLVNLRARRNNLVKVDLSKSYL